MTYPQAAYFKLLLLCGQKDELQQYIDNALLTQNPLSEIILELSTAGQDKNKLLSVLNEYLIKATASEVDYDNAVFDLVMSLFQRMYLEDKASIEEITRLMYQIAVKTERYSHDPWNTMYLYGNLYDEAMSEYIEPKSYMNSLDEFIKNKTPNLM